MTRPDIQNRTLAIQLFRKLGGQAYEDTKDCDLLKGPKGLHWKTIEHLEDYLEKQYAEHIFDNLKFLAIPLANELESIVHEPLREIITEGGSYLEYCINHPDGSPTNRKEERALSIRKLKEGVDAFAKLLRDELEEVQYCNDMKKLGYDDDSSDNDDDDDEDEDDGGSGGGGENIDGDDSMNVEDGGT
jgi:hypothetical protein